RFKKNWNLQRTSAKFSQTRIKIYKITRNNLMKEVFPITEIE
ncbi:17321_t:CDS:1, partial [Entrophospora sp. SA101]